VGKMLRGVLACGLLATALLLPRAVQAQADKQPEWTPEEKELADKATKLNSEGEQLYATGKRKEAAEKIAAALELRRKLYPPERFPDGRAELATSLNNMAAVRQALGEPAKALPSYEEALAMRRKLYPPARFPDGHPHLATSLNNIGTVLMALGEPAKALPHFEQALAMQKKLYPPERFPNGYPPLALALNSLGYVLLDMGKPARAVSSFEEALAMCRKLYPPERFKDGHPLLAANLTGLGVALRLRGEPVRAVPYHEEALAMYQKLYPADRFPAGHPEPALNLDHLGAALEGQGESARALSCYEQALAMRRKLYPPERFPDGHPDLATSLNTLGWVLQSLGEPARALPYCEQALAMRKKLYPPERFKDGHPYLADSLSNVGTALDALREPAKALPYCEQALAMRQKLFPPERFKDGHPRLATCLNDVAAVLQALGEPARALPYQEEALAMRRKLYPADRFPNGHPDLAQSLDNLGFVLQALGEPAKALPYFEQALATYRKLYPPEPFQDGHPHLAGSLSNVGFVRAALGEPDKALPYFEQALAMYHRLGKREMGAASEAQALASRAALLPARDEYLSAAVQSSPPAVRYDLLWHTRGELLPLLQARHQAILAQLAESADVRRDYEKLSAVRRRISRLQSASPEEETALQARDKELTDLNDEQDRLERRLAAGLPPFQRLRGLAAKGPADLAAELPKESAFVDFYRHIEYEKEKAVGRRYLAFVVCPGREAKPVPLGDAKEIDAAVAAWRKHLDSGQESLAPAKLRELVWDRVAAELPATTKVVYLCPDGDLARLPFAALPGARTGTILLEDHALAVVPSGPWLLEQLLYPGKAGAAPDRVLAVGDVAYGRPAGPGQTKYQALAGTGREMKRVLEAFGQQASDGLVGDAATTAAVRERLPKVRYAHFATHGYFDAKSLSAERQRLKDYLDKWTLHEDSQRPGLGLHNPAGYVGLVLAGANDPSKAGPDGGILTGLGVVDLPLEGLRLCVLSACETGLGELTEAEGVLGLQRAFHAAGCPNVIGSLWQVDDEATAALMTQFYHELRHNHQSPLEALRVAQLTLYRHPERIGALAGSRGRIDLEDAVKLGAQPPQPKPGATARTTPVKLWAAFVLSGRGE
jgi:CHAT domain-containing protein/tetratricopeptide (TPR) repeat protein